MYRAKQYEVTEIGILLEVIEAYPFATVTSVVDGRANVNHLPITSETQTNRTIRLVGHMSRHNPQWKHIRDGSDITIVFQGPHTYINPSWYTEDDVPTWNYVVVHAIGRAALIEDYSGLIQILKKQTDHMNRTHADQWAFFLPEDLRSERDLTSAIIGFEMTPVEVIGKFKLSQNRSKADQIRVIESLDSRPDEASRQLRNWMSKFL